MRRIPINLLLAGAYLALILAWGLAPIKIFGPTHELDITQLFLAFNQFALNIMTPVLAAYLFSPVIVGGRDKKSPPFLSYAQIYFVAVVATVMFVATVLSVFIIGPILYNLKPFESQYLMYALVSGIISFVGVFEATFQTISSIHGCIYQNYKLQIYSFAGGALVLYFAWQRHDMNLYMLAIVVKSILSLILIFVNLNRIHQTDKLQDYLSAFWMNSRFHFTANTLLKADILLEKYFAFLIGPGSVSLYTLGRQIASGINLGAQKLYFEPAQTEYLKRNESVLLLKKRLPKMILSLTATYAISCFVITAFILKNSIGIDFIEKSLIYLLGFGVVTFACPAIIVNTILYNTGDRTTGPRNGLYSWVFSLLYRLGLASTFGLPGLFLSNSIYYFISFMLNFSLLNRRSRAGKL